METEASDIKWRFQIYLLSCKTSIQIHLFINKYSFWVCL